MADLSDIENALVAAIAQALYPDGTGSPSVVGAPCRIFRGWPLPQRLDADLKAGTINVSVFPTDVEGRVTRYGRDWQELPITPPQMAATAANHQITLAGTPTSPLNVAAVVDGEGYVYAVQPGDTLANIATGLAAQIAQITPAVSAGPSITIPGAYRLEARVGSVGTVIREIRRQKRAFQVTCWCANPGARDAAASAIDAALADVDFLSLPDGTAGRLLYERSRVSDDAQGEGVYRRDLFYSVEYATTRSRTAAQVLVQTLNLADWDGDALPPRPAAILLEDGSYLLLEHGGRLATEARILTPDGLRLEAGGDLLTEGGGRLLLDDAPQVPSLVLLENGGRALLEDGSHLLLES